MRREGNWNIGGWVYLTIHDKRVYLIGSKSKHRFSLTCLTIEIGDATISVSIFEAYELDSLACFGCDCVTDER